MPISRLEFRARRLARRLTLVLGLGAGAAACDGGTPLPPSSDVTSPPAAATPVATVTAPTRAGLEAEAATQLDHLRELQIVEVRDLVLALPAQASACYGLPCPDSTWDGVVTDELSRQVPRLTALVAIANDAVHNSYPVPIETTEATADLRTLNAFNIVDLGDLLVSKPENNPSCYNIPCQSDIAKAEWETGMRAFFLHAWTTRAVLKKP